MSNPKFKIYVISDNHWRHWHINKYCKRGFKSLAEMDSTMLKRWNAVVRKEDMVIHLGDIVFTKGKSVEIAEILKKLNGRKILVVGNHDRKSYSWYCNNGFDFVAERLIWKFNNKTILFIHNPAHITPHDIGTCNYVFHGHVHEKGDFITKKKKCKIVNMCVEKIKYTPMNLVSLLDRLKGGYYEKQKSSRRKK